MYIYICIFTVVMYSLYVAVYTIYDNSLTVFGHWNDGNWIRESSPLGPLGHASQQRKNMWLRTWH